jgi:hypothetical protein
LGFDGVQEFPDFGENAFAPERSAAEPPESVAFRMPGWAVLCSLAFHVLLIAALSVSAVSPRAPAPVESVAVEILTSAQFDALARPKPAPPAPGDAGVPPQSPPSGEPAPQSLPSSPTPSALVRATEMMSARDLARPQSRQAVAAMKGMSDADRIDQLCAIEASAQIHAWRTEFQPERLVSFATHDTRMDSDVLIADGAAFRSRANWYRLKFHCGLTQDHTRVASFEFEVGQPVPRDEWEEDSLAAVH